MPTPKNDTVFVFYCNHGVAGFLLHGFEEKFPLFVFYICNDIITV